jgi:hypothetical protein
VPLIDFAYGNGEQLFLQVLLIQVLESLSPGHALMTCVSVLLTYVPIAFRIKCLVLVASALWLMQTCRILWRRRYIWFLQGHYQENTSVAVLAVNAGTLVSVWVCPVL